MPISKQLFGYNRSDVDQYRENHAREEEGQLAELDGQVQACRSQIKGLLSQIERMIMDLDRYNDQDRSIANRVWEQVRVLEEVRHQTGLQIKEAVNLTADKLERLEAFYRLLDQIRFKIGGLSSELAEAGRFGSPTQEHPQKANQIQERGTQIEV